MTRAARRPLALLAAAASLACALAAPRLALAGGFHISIIRGRRNGMMANIAAPDDLTAIFHNPAGLADRRGLRLGLFGSVTFLSQEFEMMALDPERFPEINPAGCGEACPWPIGEDGYYTRPITPESTFGALPFLGFASDLGSLHPRLRDVVVSVAGYAPNFYGGTLPDDAPTAYYMTDGYFLVASATFGLGWRLSDHLSLGFNVSYNYMQLIYGQKLSFVDVLTGEGEAPGGLAELMQDIYGDILLGYTGLDHGAGCTASALVRPTGWLSLGFAFSWSTAPRFEGPLELSPTREGAPGLEEVEAFGYDLPRRLEVGMLIPPSLGFGVSVAPLDWLEVAADLRLWLYNLYDHQTMRPIYGADQTGIHPMTEESLSREKEYDLSYEVALGFLFRPLRGRRDLELMLGLAYDQSPVPDEYFSLDNPALSQAILSAGARWQVTDHWRVMAAYMAIFYLERDITTSLTSPPTNVRGRGFNHIPSVEVEYLF